jgi:hypothetical protein
MNVLYFLRFTEYNLPEDWEKINFL